LQLTAAGLARRLAARRRLAALKPERQRPLVPWSALPAPRPARRLLPLGLLARVLLEQVQLLASAPSGQRNSLRFRLAQSARSRTAVSADR
jgi:hypothetical protein